MLLTWDSIERAFLKAALLLLVSNILNVLTASTPALATQDGWAPIEEIIVVARKREERLQDVPISISVFSADDIASSGIRSMADVANLTPGLTIAPLFGVDFWTPVIRGLSTTIGEPNVGFFIDGVYQSSRTSMPQLLGNFIDHIEVAKGPQSALYGRNTFGGAINYVTRRPSDTLEGELEATLGEYGQRHVQGGLGGPLSPEGWHYRVSGLWDEFDGYFHNNLTGGNLDASDTDALLFTIDGALWDSVIATLNLSYENTNSGDNPLLFVQNNAEFAPRFNDFQVYSGKVPSNDNFAVTPGGLDSEAYTASLLVDWDLGGRTLTSLTGYNELQYDRNVDDDYSAPEYHWASQLQNQDEWSQELRLSTESDQRLQWMAGLYLYSLDHTDTVTSSYIGDFSYLGGLHTTTDMTVDEAAAFGSLGFSLLENVQATLEARYANEKKHVKAMDTLLNEGATSEFDKSHSWNMFLPKITIDWRIDDQNMTYASYAKSEKSGGYNIITTSGVILPDERTYEPEKSNNYEIGLKSNFYEGRYMTTLAVFLIDWQDQIVRGLGDSLAVLNTNVGTSTSQGLEFELTGQPTDRIRVRLGAAYTDAKYDEYNFDVLETFLGIDPVMDGNPLPLVSEWMVNMGVEYTRPSSIRDWDIFSRLDWDYRSAQSIVETNDATVGSSARLNLRLGVRNPFWAVTLWGRNVLDEDTAATGVFIPNPAMAPQVDTAQRDGFQVFQALVTTPEPRSWGITVNYGF